MLKKSDQCSAGSTLTFTPPPHFDPTNGRLSDALLLSKTVIVFVAYRGGYRILKGAGPTENEGQKACMNFPTWGTFSAKFAPAGALSL